MRAPPSSPTPASAQRHPTAERDCAACYLFRPMVKRGRREPREAKRARAAESERRARMFVHAHLAWLEGFPELTAGGLRWHRLDGTAPFLVDSALVARARRAQKTLVSDHRDALEKVVGNVEHWGAAVDGALTAIVQAL